MLQMLLSLMECALGHLSIVLASVVTCLFSSFLNSVRAPRLHLQTFCRQFCWHQLMLWPTDMPELTVLMLSTCDPLVPSKLVKATLEVGYVHNMLFSCNPLVLQCNWYICVIHSPCRQPTLRPHYWSTHQQGMEAS